jgi:hypothetical protein
MKVAILGKTLEIPDGPVPENPDDIPIFIELKKLVEEEFLVLFDRKIDINNWGYVFSRAYAHKISSAPQ